MTITSQFATLLASKAAKDGRRNIPLTEVEKDTRISWKTLQQWAENKITRYDSKTLDALCAYLDCTVGDLLTYEPDSVQPLHIEHYNGQ